MFEFVVEKMQTTHPTFCFFCIDFLPLTLGLWDSGAIRPSRPPPPLTNPQLTWKPPADLLEAPIAALWAAKAKLKLIKGSPCSSRILRQGPLSSHLQLSGAILTWNPSRMRGQTLQNEHQTSF